MVDFRGRWGAEGRERTGAGAIGVGALVFCALAIGCGGRGVGAALTSGAAGPGYAGPVFVEVAPASDHVCALSMDGKVYCWGENEDGQLGTGDKDPRVDPVVVSGIADAKHVAAGNGYTGSGTTCAILTDSTLWCWGLNRNGQLGRGDMASSGTPKVVLDSTMQPLEHVVQVSVSGNSEHVCAVRDDRTVWCWGNNLRAQTGRDPAESAAVTFALQVPNLTDVAQVSSGSGNTCAAKTDGTVWCWGSNDTSQSGADAGRTCGPEPLPCVEAPQLIGSGSDYRAVAAGSTSCALTRDGAVECWGTARATYGFPGDDGSAAIAPRLVAGLGDVTTIRMNNGASKAAGCALKNDNTLWCWGDNSVGELGPGTDVESSTAPRAIVGLPTVRGFGAQLTNCAISTADGSLWCWGSNSGKQLAAANGGDTADRVIPSPGQIRFGEILSGL
jgi:alpha-tubulin suppressor-like RCC1 family protein